MNINDKYIFDVLKKKIEQSFLERNKSSLPIKNWKGNDIVAFQEDLFKQVKEKVSEKWFYTYIKNNPSSLPRIDILNFLSAYVGHKNWNTFQVNFNYKKKEKVIKYKLYLYIFLGAIFIFYMMFLKQKTNSFNFCFIDEDKKENISTILSIKILQENESSIYLKTDSLGCFNYTTKTKSIKFVVQSPYYKTDTILRFIGTKTENTINLQTDDYALMLQYYTNGNTKDWQKRRKLLDSLFEENAQIYQLFSHSNTIELYSKTEFIRKLTIPTSSLKGIKILDKTYENGKIVKLKFMIK